MRVISEVSFVIADKKGLGAEILIKIKELLNEESEIFILSVKERHIPEIQNDSR